VEYNTDITIDAIELSQNLVTVIEDRRSSPRIIVRQILCLSSRSMEY